MLAVIHGERDIGEAQLGAVWMADRRFAALTMIPILALSFLGVPGNALGRTVGDQSRAVNVAAVWDGKAACLAPAAFNENIIRARIRPIIAKEPRISESVAGYSLKSQPRLLVRALRTLAPLEGKVARSAADPVCRQIRCAALSLFGADAGRLLHMLLRFGYNGSPYAASGATAWTRSELDVVLAAMGDLPPNTLPFSPSPRLMVHEDHLSPLNRIPLKQRPNILPLAMSSDEAGVRVADAWDGLSQPERRAVLFHELAHEFAANRGGRFDWRGLWLEAATRDAAWGRKIGHPTGSVSIYGETGIDEDFAESATAYRYAPRLLALRAPHRYDFLREWMFDGLEYFSSQQCMPGLARSELIKRETDALLRETRPPSRVKVRGYYRQCLADGVAEDELGPCALRNLYWERYQSAWRAKASHDRRLSEAALDHVRRNERFLEFASADIPPALRENVLSYLDTEAPPYSLN